MAGTDIPETEAIIGFGHEFQVNGVALAQVIDITGPGIKVNDVDKTHADQDEPWKEFIPGLIDGGEVKVTLNYTEANAAAVLALVGVAGNKYTVLFSDGYAWTFDGYCNGMDNESKMADAQTIDANFKITGKPDFGIST